MPTNQWHSLNEFKVFEPNNNQYEWLSEDGSMTAKLRSATDLTVVVNLKSSAHIVPNKEETIFFDMPEAQSVYIREVIMSVGDSDWMFGRTIIPDETLAGEGEQLKLLGTNPLGTILFDPQYSERVLIEVAKISNKHFLYPHSLVKNLSVEDELELWARRSVFHFFGKPLLVQEVFLPDCPINLPSI